jgi:hypothetical protein
VRHSGRVESGALRVQRTVRGKLRLPKYRHEFREFLAQNVDPSYVRWEANAQFSPDGRWIAYTSDETGRLFQRRCDKIVAIEMSYEAYINN